MPLIFADTSVWVSHFRHAEPTLQALLATDQVLCHPPTGRSGTRLHDAARSSRADARRPPEASSAGNRQRIRNASAGDSGATLRFRMWGGGCPAPGVRPSDSRRAVVDAGQEACGSGDPTGSVLQGLQPLARKVRKGELSLFPLNCPAASQLFAAAAIPEIVG